LIGVVVREELGNFGPQIVVESNDEEIVLPSLTALKTKLSEAQVGDKIKVVYLGKVTSKKSGKVYDDFDVFIKKPIKG